MDKIDASQWLKEVEAAANEAAPKIVASVDGIAEQRMAILQVCVSALLKAAMHDAAREVLGNLFSGSGFGVAPRVDVVDGGGDPRFGNKINFGDTAVRRFI